MNILLALDPEDPIRRFNRSRMPSVRLRTIGESAPHEPTSSSHVRALQPVLPTNTQQPTEGLRDADSVLIA